MSFNFRYYLAQMPLVKLALSFAGGVIAGIYFPFQSTIFIALSALILLISATIIIRNSFSSGQLSARTFTSSVLIWIAVFFAGIALSETHKQIERQTHFSKFATDEAFLKIQITKPVNLKSKSAKVEGKVIEVINEESSHITTGKIQLYLQKDSLSETLSYGDVIVITSKVNEFTPPMNPKEFNYKQYMSFKNIYHQAYAGSNYWHKTGINNGNKVLSKLYALRSNLSEIIDTYIAGNDEKAIANAILIGNKDLLDDKITRAYATSGAMHVLAVSGLHVGIIYVIFGYMLSFLKKNRWKKAIPFLLIALIWFYALITGGSPSVLRAATMFSFISLGSAFGRHLSIYNAIAASMFVLVAINPFIITEVGFQLSYLAVIGIIFLQPKIYRLYLPKNKLLDNIWAITAVSIAAQIATFPLGVLYFHQFPNLFWVSNLVVIPAATIIVYGGVLLFAFSWFEWLAVWIGKVLNLIIYLLNQCVGVIDRLPYSLSSGLDITVFETYIIYGIIIAASLAFAFRMKKALFSAIVFSLIMGVSYSIKNISRTNQTKMIVYHTPKQSSIEFVKGKTVVSKFDESLLENESQLLFRVKHNWWEMGVRNHQDFHSSSVLLTKEIEGNTLVKFEHLNILLIDSVYKIPSEPFKCDYVIVSNNPKLYLNKFSEKVEASKYIFDSSNPLWKIKYWEQDCIDLNLNCYFVTKNEAYVRNL